MKPVIVAEDNESSRIVCRMGINSALQGVNIDFVENGRDLVERVRTSEYGLIITDYDMPSLNGLEAIEEIKKFNQEIPILMVSGSNIREKAIEAGATDYLEKPVSPDNFKSTIKRLYEGTKN